MLDAGALAISSFKKKLALRLWENHSLSNAACAHALCHSEASDIASLIPNVPIALIPMSFIASNLINEYPTLDVFKQSPWWKLALW